MGNEQSSEAEGQRPEQVPNTETGLSEPAKEAVPAQASVEAPTQDENSKDPPPLINHGFSRYLSGLGDFFSTDSASAVSASSEVVNNLGSYMSLEAVKEALTGEDKADEPPSSSSEEPSKDAPANDAKVAEHTEQESSAAGLTAYLTTSFDGVSELFRSLTQESSAVATEACAETQEKGANLQAYLPAGMEGVSALFKTGSSENNEVLPSFQDAEKAAPVRRSDTATSATPAIEEPAAPTASEEQAPPSAEEQAPPSTTAKPAAPSTTEEQAAPTATEETA
ncbi:hypothetical protein TGGT1_212210 [Toxoplasma gondii GT1]|uniref:Uncharacterized protein n=3 Tax=Toxoplasma gondii TaxID=5811 RepID=S7WBM6_TOXGG|nr:hypothetical protein TGGT1_212210 [Toxoplasma gondii GT1]KAF4640371.1 hypothetical protein TGRH88_042970 [Toxoplasma gondii]PIM03740.1 hypothetical protein TGCOUG_212210 [Toxoplasma gondii COUG]